MRLLQTTDLSRITDDKMIDFILSYSPTQFKARSTVLTLDNPTPPSGPHNHSKMTPNDKEIWDKSYMIEYSGLHEKTQTWTYISEQEYKT